MWYSYCQEDFRSWIPLSYQSMTTRFVTIKIHENFILIVGGLDHNYKFILSNHIYIWIFEGQLLILLFWSHFFIHAWLFSLLWFIQKVRKKLINDKLCFRTKTIYMIQHITSNISTIVTYWFKDETKNQKKITKGFLTYKFTHNE